MLSCLYPENKLQSNTFLEISLETKNLQEFMFYFLFLCSSVLRLKCVMKYILLFTREFI